MGLEPSRTPTLRRSSLAYISNRCGRILWNIQSFGVIVNFRPRSSEAEQIPSKNEVGGSIPPEGRIRKSYSVYAIQNTITLKRYIGKAKDPFARWESHKHAAILNKGYLLQTAIRKYGIENFTFEIIKSFPSDKKL